MTAPAVARPHPISLPTTAMDLVAWLGHAEPGDRIDYHHGFLVIDTMPRSDRLAERARLGLLDVARVAYRAAECGLAHLVQVRHGPDCFAYLLVARPRPRRGAGSLAEFVAMEAA